MNRRTAKRWACGRGALLIQSAMDCGWPFNDSNSLQTEAGELNANGERVTAALVELTKELENRGLLPTDVEPVTEEPEP